MHARHVAVPDEEPEGDSPAGEVHDQVAGLLGSPGAVRVPGHPEDVHSPGRYLHDEQHVKALKEDRVHGEEVAREQALGLRAQEGAPGGVQAARSGPVAPGTENPPDSRLTNPKLRLLSVNPLACRGFTVWVGVAGVYSKVIGMVAPRRSKAARCAGVGMVIFSIWWPPMVMVWRVRVARWSTRSRKLRTGWPAGSSGRPWLQRRRSGGRGRRGWRVGVGARRCR